jgi:protein-S-isoprenylcysteine O-methyltransferase Ste14
MDIYFLGIALIYPNVLFILIAAGTITGIHFQILREEIFLQRKFGEEYAAYKKQTRRYF